MSHNKDTFDHCILTDPSGHWRCGACFASQWLQHAWSPEWVDVSIMVKELVPSFSVHLSGAQCWPDHIQFSTVVEAVNKGSFKDQMVLHLLRCPQALFDIFIHVGVQNSAAYMLSRNQGSKLLQSYLHSSLVPAAIPLSLQEIVLSKSSALASCHLPTSNSI